MKAIHQVIFEPYVTEKSSMFMLDEQSGSFKYAFKVNPSANKIEIKQAIEKRFGVVVDSVNVIRMRGKVKKVRLQAGRRPNWKKAMVKLQPGHSISEFEGV